VNPDAAHSALVSMLVVALGIETYVEFKGGNIPPHPARFVGVCVLYGLLAMLVHASAGLAAVLGLGMLIALIVKLPAMTGAETGAPPPAGNAPLTKNPGVISL
jgi:hypothetical protein